mmetsp:Transcript_18901/g.41183  ORF Transcript_18901/g.41183 Transcript_18901/m.41183 type:complete len:240 (+) Transcript_18901:2755-3474(+)
MPDFNHDFDKAHEEHLILALQQEVGCFACGKYASSGCDGITKPRCKGLRACTKCKVATYCSKRCQKIDWKRPPGGEHDSHKRQCEVYHSNREPYNERGDIWPVEISFRACGWFSEAELAGAMDTRTELFLIECSNAEVACIHLQASVVFNIGHSRLQMAASFWDEGAKKVARVSVLTFYAVDEGEEAKRRLHPSPGSGDLSASARTKAADKLKWFIKQANDKGIEIASTQYGRGLMWMS